MVAAMASLLVLLLVVSVNHSNRARRNQCYSNLRQIGLAFKTWSLDSSDRFAHQIEAQYGGAKEPAEAGQVYFVFVVLSNELSTPKILTCPYDRDRTALTNFAPALCNSNVSYFVGLNANDTDPLALLSGDRNLAFRGAALPPAVFAVTTNMILTWTREIHRGSGNLLFADGSAQFVRQPELATAVHNQGVATNRLAIP